MIHLAKAKDVLHILRNIFPFLYILVKMGYEGTLLYYL